MRLMQRLAFFFRFDDKRSEDVRDWKRTYTAFAGFLQREKQEARAAVRNGALALFRLGTY